MIMADLKTNYVDDKLDVTKNQIRKYRQIQNDDGTVSFVDVTEYTQVGTSFGAKDINDTNAAINEVNSKLTWKRIGNTSVTGAVSVTIPTDASEVIIKANLGYNIIVNIPIPVAFLGSTEQSYRGGYFQNGSNGAMADFKCTSSKVTLNNAFLNANSVTSTTEWAVHYR